MTDLEREAMRENCRPEYLQKLQAIASDINLEIAFQGSTRVRGWPQKSSKPWSLRYADWTLLAAFRTLEQLERNLRGRAGC